MIALLLTILFGLGFAYFATLNTVVTTIRFDSYVLDMPVYLVILGSVLIGIVMATVIHFINSFSNYIEIHRKERVVKEMKKTLAEIIRRVHKLEIEGERKEEENGEANPIKEGKI